ncbi:MAG: ribulose-phosphate 3-epimerase [Bacilli bacterium]
MISVSYLSSFEIGKDLKKLNETDVDFIHVDVMDGKYVPAKTISFKEVKNIYKYTSKRLDVHLMVENPINYIKDYALLNAEYITIHIEDNNNILDCIKLIKSYGIKVGLSLKPNTLVSALTPYLEYIDLVLLMAVEPGKSGQTFMESTYPKINELKELIKNYKYIKISVDGGINKEVSDKLTDVDIKVSGSYIINSNNFQEKITSLR